MHRRVVLALCGALAILGTAAGLALAWSGSDSADRASAPSVPRFSASSIRDFALNQSVPGAVTEVADPAGGGEDVIKMAVSNDDVYPRTPTRDPRAELLSPTSIQPGDQLWWSAKFLLPRDFPVSVPHWVTVLEGPFGPPYAGTPPWHIEVTHQRIQWSRNHTYGWDVPWQMPLVRGRWIEVLVHCRLAAHGFVEMWIDGERVTFFRGSPYNPDHHAPTQRLRMRTLDRTNDEGSNYVSVLNYRKRDTFPWVTVFQGPLALGPTRASVTP